MAIAAAESADVLPGALADLVGAEEAAGKGSVAAAQSESGERSEEEA